MAVAASAALAVALSLAALEAARAGGGMGLPSASSCRKGQAVFVQFWYLHNNLDGPAESPKVRKRGIVVMRSEYGTHQV